MQNSICNTKTLFHSKRIFAEQLFVPIRETDKTILISSHILSEIALLADDIGIIDHGVLLEENSMETLKRKNSKYILLQVSDIPKTSLVLERQTGSIIQGV